MKIIIGLGNPGEKFKNTRHNVGFDILDFFLQQNKHSVIEKNNESHISQTIIGTQKSLLIKPQMYMNLSGIVVRTILKKYSIKIEDILVIVDDVYLSEGEIKLKPQGGHGGHNGLRNIINCCGTKQFKRLKIGVDYDSNVALDKYLLTSLKFSSQNHIYKKIDSIFDIIKKFIKGVDFNILMSCYNSKN
ncbi:aminoacyl-tRNA hydrolase ['Fragaria x ananassa' phyllody phytoplasma]|uniref:Peptidyl-tRNA hydrolase n=1 Tax='Fragaria x ananassa' phyllody phytoplasma TaxID=2358428 RepID=A0ABS5K3B5_9MOLU|nr:aminoacyl-tRNA hydrolase ['Fragaria x ananassa' phyllody phytoplasma]MBS2126400.1 aminoacyl-tRNA hydrolase ['Fragaria x ananassa' phyllody phytoplasma]